MNTFGQNITAFRKNKNLTQEKLAELIGISPQSVSKWENDVTMPDIALLPILADIFSTSIDSLFGIGVSSQVNREQIPEKAIDSILHLIGSQFSVPEEEFDQYKRAISESNGTSTALFTDIGGAVWANEDLGIIFRKSPEDFESSLASHLAVCRPIFELLTSESAVRLLGTMLKNTTASSAAYLGKKSGISAEEAASVLEKLETANLAMRQNVNIDDNSITLWRISSTHKMLFIYTMLVSAKKILDDDNYYCYCGSKLWCK